MRLLIIALLLLLLGAGRAAADAGDGDGTPIGGGTPTDEGVIVTIGTGTGGSGPGSGAADGCEYQVVDWDELIATIEALLLPYPISVDTSDADPSVYDAPWVIVWCPAADGFTALVNIYQLGDPPPVDALREHALRALVLPLPDPAFSPDAAHFQVVGLHTWIWTPTTTFTPAVATACIPGACATATATPTHLVADMGNGHTVTCDGPGRAYDPTIDYDTQAAYDHCWYVYETDSHTQPDQRYHVTTATIWAIAWTCTWDADTNGTNESSCGGGPLGTLARQGTPVPLDVRQYQAIITTPND
jgi:hypothetical protein